MPGSAARSTSTVPLPVNADDVANKAYVDAAVAGSPSTTFARVVKKVDQTVTNSIVHVDDDELSIALLANKVYGYLLFIMVNSDATADYNHAFGLPAGATAIRTAILRGDNFQASTDMTVDDQYSTDGTDQNIMLAGRIVMGGTAGSVVLQWSQDIAQALDCKVLQGSYFVVWEELP